MLNKNQIDVLIIGAGPAGLQAAIHAARKKASVLVVGRPEKSSLYRAHMENYLFLDGIKQGPELLDIGMAQIKRFGADFVAEDVLHIEHKEEKFLVNLESGTCVDALSIVFATGTSRKKLKVKGEEELSGKGVSYCVDCDANFYRNVPVAIIGNESAAADGALTMLAYASEVYLIARELTVTRELKAKLKDSKVHLLSPAWVKEIHGESSVSGLLLDDDRSIEVEGVFIELGAKGALELATNIGVQLDTESFTHIAVNNKQETNIPGAYAAGDITGHPYQVAKAVGEGCIAGMSAATYALHLRKKTI